MNTLMLISFSLLFFFNCVSSPETEHCSDVTAKDTEEIHLQHRINSVRYYLEEAKKRKIVHHLDWDKLGTTVIRIYETDNDIDFIFEATDWLVRYIPPERWDEPETAIHQFLKDSRDKPDREQIRLKLLDLLVFKAPIPDYSTSRFTDFLFDPMPSIRRFMIQTLKENGTKDAIPSIEKRITELKSKPSPTKSDLEEITLAEEAVVNIRLWAERLEKGWVPTEYETKQLAEMILHKWPHAWGSGYIPPGYMDGPDYIVKRWQTFKWGAALIVKSDAYHKGQKAGVVRHILSRVHDDYWNEAFPIIMHYYNTSDSYVTRGGVMDELLKRNSGDDLHRLSYLMTSEDQTDHFAIGRLIRKHAEIGTKEHLSELRIALEFWKEKDKIGTVEAIENAISSIEQRFGITPAAETGAPATQEEK